MKSLSNKCLELLLAAIWVSVAKLIILSNNHKKMFNYTQKQHRKYYDQLVINDDYNAVCKYPLREFIWRAIAVTYVRYVCMPNQQYFS